MPLWGKTDVASNSVIWAPATENQAPTRTNANLMFGNTTANGYGTGETIGMYGVDATEMSVGAGGVASITITSAGSGYTANATVTISGGGGASATANATANTSTGKIQIVNITAAGSSYETNPTVVIAAPTAITFNALSAVSNTDDTIALTTANSKFLVGDSLTYTVNTGNTAVGGLTSGETYYVVAANSTTIKLGTTQGGSVINLTAGVTETGHNLTGQQATAVATVGGAQNKGVAHAGWVIRREGTGGRAGRVQYETLVAMGSMASDASDDTVLPDS
jgi:hypothetical protein